jgi:hypothetical protein
MDAHHDTALARAALCLAIAIRGGSVAGVVFHTDQGANTEEPRTFRTVALL